MDELVASLGGLHASDPATPFVSAWARLRPAARANAVPALERALYDDRSLVRALAMRRTMFVVPPAVVPVAKAACTDPLVERERQRAIRLLGKDARWLRRVRDKTLTALERRGEATAGSLLKEIPEFGEPGVSTRVLFLLATEQLVVRSRPEGAWTSSRYRWSLMRHWVGSDVEVPPANEARAELARRYLAAYGPATTDDLKWWTGWSQPHTAQALSGVAAVEVAAGLYVLPDDVEPVKPPAPWVALLPSLDSTVMGWRHRDWYLGAHAGELFDRNGNAGPTAWVSGAAVGGWAQRGDGEVVVEVLEEVGSEARAKLAAVADDLQRWLGEIRLRPRYPSPLHRRLTS